MNITFRTLVTLATFSLPFCASADSASINYRHQLLRKTAPTLIESSWAIAWTVVWALKRR